VYFLEAFVRMGMAGYMLVNFTAIGMATGFAIGVQYAWASLSGGRERVNALTAQFQEDQQRRVR
jgi:hypothetical protein